MDSLKVNGAFIYFEIPIFGGIPITQTTVSSFVVMLIIVIASVCLGRNLKKRPGGTQVMVEKAITMLYNMVGSAMGEHNLHWAPFIGTIFMSSILGSYIGLTGFFRSSTADLSCVMVWAVSVSVIIWYNTITRNGFGGWLKGFTEPIVVMTPMNIISEIAQPVSMAFRHFGNSAGGGVITTILYLALSGVSTMVMNWIAGNGVLVSAALALLGLVLLLIKTKKRRVLRLAVGIVSLTLGVFGALQAMNILSGVPILSLGIPAVLSCYFDLFSGFVQAYVFSLLTMVYIGNSCPPPEENAAEQ